MKWSDDEERAIVTFVETGISIREISDKLKRTPKSIESKIWTMKQRGQIKK